MSNALKIKLPGVIPGDADFAIIAGPCSLESRDQFFKVAQAVKSFGGHMLRGGLFKMRTNPDSFQGLGSQGFNIAVQVKQEVGLPFVSEVTDPRQISDLHGVVDMFQVGSRNMYNYSLLKELGQTKKPVMLKRGFSATVEEWLLAADYIVKGGNDQVLLCERGIRSFDNVTRNTLDLNTVAYIKEHSDYPVIVDPSHGTGRPELIVPMSLAAMAAGADGIMVEVHHEPAQSLSDADQALSLEQFEVLTQRLKQAAPTFSRTI